MTKKKAASKSKKSSNILLIAGAFVIMAGIGWYVVSGSGTTATNKNGHTVVATLDPASFDGRAREAYQAARDIPDVLAELPCFCGCANVGHKSNLFCFKDNHGEECAMCQDIALVARAMYTQGNSVEKIRDEIISRYSRYAP